ncbi:MAG: PAS domain-containing protein, partial [Thermoplasmatota archaeon]
MGARGPDRPPCPSGAPSGGAGGGRGPRTPDLVGQGPLGGGQRPVGGHARAQAELERASLESLLHPEDRDKVALSLEDGTQSRQEVRLRRADGRWLWVEWVTTPFTENK